MKSVRTGIIIGIVALLMGLSWYLGYKKSWNTKKEAEQVSVVLEKIQHVTKLVTVEGHVSEIYDHKEYNTFDLSLFRKKALIRVNADVSAGYDFTKMKMDIDDATKTIRITDFPEAEILSIDHDLDYYDITEGSFNQFSKDDYNKINERAKAFIRSKAIDAQLLKEAELQKENLIEMIKTVLMHTGWKLEIEGQTYLG